MPLEAPRRGPPPLSFAWSVSLLACRIDITADCERVAAWLDPMLQHASQDYPISRVHRLAISMEGDRYRIEEDGAARAIEPTAESAGYAVFARIHVLALDALPEFTKVHAGCASWEGRRVLAVGPPHAGKTTLMTRLIYEGFSVQGDELVLLRDGLALPYPRRFGVRAPTVALIPQLAAMGPPGPGGPAPLVIDPAQLGFDWRIEAAPVEAVLYLEPNHGGPSRLEPCPKYQMAQRIMSQSSGPEAGKRQWIRDVCAILDRASSHVLRLGDLDAAVDAVKEALRGTPRVAA